MSSSVSSPESNLIPAVLHERNPGELTTSEPSVPEYLGSEDSATPSWLWKGNVPALNGLRAVSILLVLAGHLSKQAASQQKDSLLGSLPYTGNLGVQMFFVISGFLITLLLTREVRHAQGISLRLFYVRRMLRILPAYWAFLVGVAVFQYLGFTDIQPRSWVTAATYTTSIVFNGHWDLSHSWSLSVEEHFYLVWPLLLVVLGTRRAFQASLAYVMVTPLLRAVFSYYLNRHPIFWIVTLAKLTPLRLDGIAMGCILALLATSPRFAPRLQLSQKAFRWWFALGLGLLVSLTWVSFAFRQFQVGDYFNQFLSPSIRPALMAVLLWSAANFQGGWASFILNSRPLQAIGILSYSLYLWQQPFLSPYRSGWCFSWPINLVLAFLAACVSYACIESPFLRLKDRLGHRLRLERKRRRESLLTLGATLR